METTKSSTNRKPFGTERTSQIQLCIDKCVECFESCSDLLPHCLEMGGEHASSNHIGLISLCADICQASAKAMQFNSELKDKVCDLCADICDRCAKECEEMAADDEQMLACANTCRECAEACRNMMQ